ncbi:MAG TPA: undecaprenyl-diphosphate phosphatase, partial [Burkholderiales bacterium]
MDLLNALTLGIVEGLTEFLPVSSTGHLIVAGSLLGFAHPNRDVFYVAIQSGAMLAVLWEYRGRFFKFDLDLYRNLAVAFVPAATLGFFFSNYIKSYLFHA